MKIAILLLGIAVLWIAASMDIRRAWFPALLVLVAAWLVFR